MITEESLRSVAGEVEAAAMRVQRVPRIPRPKVHYEALGVEDALDRVTGRERADRLDDSEADVVVFVRGSEALVAPPRHRAGACYHCLERRWQQLRGEDERNALEHGVPFAQVEPLGPFLTPLTRRRVEDVIAVALQDEGAGWPSSESDAPYIFVVSLTSLRVARHALSRDAECPRCDLLVADTADGARIEFSSRPKPRRDATRLSSIYDYPLDVGTYSNPVCGVLGSVAGHAFDSTTTAPVTGYTRIRGDHSLHEFFWSGHADNFADSHLLGILEGLERHAGLRERRIRPSVVDTYANVRDQALDPRSVGLYPERFYELIGPRFTAFSEDLEIPWVWAWSVREQRPLLVPHAFVYYLLREDRPNFVQDCSNGCATGSCLEEATLYGLLELLERDAFLLAWYGKASLPEIDVDTCRSRETRMMVDRLRLVGYDVRLFDNRIDFPVPTVTAVAVRRDGGLGTLCFAAGSSLDPEDAVRAALCEIASYVPSFPERVAENLDLVRAMQDNLYLVRELKHHALLFGVPEMAHHADFLLDPPGGAVKRSMEDTYRDWERCRPRTDDLRDDLDFLIRAIADRGMDVIVADQTSAEERPVGLSTVATIVPGLVPIDFGWTMQRVLTMRRLRTVFQEVGWRADELGEDDLNMVPHPFP